MLSDVMLSVVMLNVVAPYKTFQSNNYLFANKRVFNSKPFHPNLIFVNKAYSS
jgi:hypothetical protein